MLRARKDLHASEELYAKITLSRMQLSDQDIRAFQEIWQREFGEAISADFARARASDLIELFLTFQKLWPKVEARRQAHPSSHEIPSRPGYPENPRTVGEHLKKARLDRGIRQNEAARSIGCRPATLGTWEKGRVAVDVRFWPAIFRFLGLRPRPEPDGFGGRLKRAREDEGLYRITNSASGTCQ